MLKMRSALASLLVLPAWLAMPGIGLAQESALSPEDSLRAAEIFEELIEIPSVSGTPETVQAARAMAERLRAAGFPDEDVHVLETLPDVGMLVARYRGTGERPPIRAMRKRGENPPRARLLVFRPRWATDKESLTAGRVPETFCFVGPADRDVAYSRIPPLEHRKL